MGTTTTVFIAILLTINIITIVLYTIDKRRAKKGQWRISEKVLLIWALFAPWGAYTGMKLAHHKTQNKKFTVLIPLFMILHFLLVLGFIYYKLR